MTLEEIKKELGKFSDVSANFFTEVIARTNAETLIDQAYQAGRESILAELPGEVKPNGFMATKPGTAGQQEIGFNRAIELVKNIIRERKV